MKGKKNEIIQKIGINGCCGFDFDRSERMLKQ